MKEDPDHLGRKWDELANSDVVCSRPVFDMTLELANEMVNSTGIHKSLSGKKVLCLANGGGQQSVAFSLLGADVTVLDISQEQLIRDIEAARSYDYKIETVKRDFRDLSTFGDAAFDVVSQGYSINFVRELGGFFDEVSRILKSAGIFDLFCHNPMTHGSWIDGCWGGRWKQDDLWGGIGYPLRLPYVEGEEVDTIDPFWNFHDRNGNEQRIASPKEYRHLLSTLINGVIRSKMKILEIEEIPKGNRGAEVGTWDHYTSVAPAWMRLWAEKE